jgi:hypothetical protein
VLAQLHKEAAVRLRVGGNGDGIAQLTHHAARVNLLSHCCAVFVNRNIRRSHRRRNNSGSNRWFCAITGLAFAAGAGACLATCFAAGWTVTLGLWGVATSGAADQASTGNIQTPMSNARMSIS